MKFKFIHGSYKMKFMNILKFKMFIISKNYLPLVAVKLGTPLGFFETLYSIFIKRYTVMNKIILKSNIIDCLEFGKGDFMVCSSLDDAYKIVSFYLKGHNTTSDFIQPGIQIFASIVIFETNLKFEDDEFREIKVEDIINYVNTSTIPLYQSFNDFQYKELDESLKGLNISHTSSILRSNLKKAHYVSNNLQNVTIKLD